MSIGTPPFPLRPLARERYDRLGSQTWDDDKGGWVLAGLVDAKAAMWDDLEHVAREDDQGRPGWAVAADPATCRRGFLPWAAQLYGMSVAVEDIAPTVPDSVVDANRQRVIDRPSQKYGTTAAIVAAYRSAMTGTNLIVRDRYDADNPGPDAPYHLTLVAKSSQVPDPAEALRRALEAKPAWVVLHVQVTDVRDWQEIADTYPNWQAVLDGNATWSNVLYGN